MTSGQYSEDYIEDYRTAEQIAAERGYEVRLVREVIA